MDEQPISEFNAALANAYNAHDLRVKIQQALVFEDYNTAQKCLKCLSYEVIAWYSKSEKNADRIKDLKLFMINSAKAKKGSLLFKKIINDWNEQVLIYAYDIWFGLEKDKVGSLFT